MRAKLAGPGTPDPALIADVARIDADNTAWLKQVVSTRGWPGKSLVSKDGAKAASLLIQHADHDRAFQKQGLALLEAAVAKGDTEAADLAYLTDRLLVAEGKPQRYGTQFHVVDGKLVPQPIEDEASVDLLRAFAGLPSLAEYKKAMQQSRPSWRIQPSERLRQPVQHVDQLRCQRRIQQVWRLAAVQREFQRRGMQEHAFQANLLAQAPVH